MKSKLFASLLLSLSLGAAAQAQIIVHTPGNAVGVNQTPAFSTLVAGGAVGTSLIAFGVDYSFGGVEGIFNDPPLAFGGVNGSGSLDLIAGVDGRIVTLNSLSQ